MSDRFKQVDGVPELVRDELSGAILYVDSNLINNRKEAKRLRKMASKRIEEVSSEVKTLRNDIDEIKQLLVQLVEK
jgi:hypothetical protein